MNKVVKTAEIGRHVRTHDLRHIHPSHLAAAGVDPATLRKRMGWSTIKLLGVHVDGVAAGDKTAVQTLDKISGVATIEVEMVRFQAEKEKQHLGTEGEEEDIPF